MKISEKWLNEWVELKADPPTLAHQLTMTGLEVESFDPVSVAFHDIVIGEVIEEAPHPNSDHLHVCKVEVMIPELKSEAYTQSISSCDEAQAQASSGHCEEFTTKQSRLPSPDDRTRNDVATKPQLERRRVYLSIVCGAANVRAGLKVPVALVGAKLPNGLIIKKAKLRGVESCGMICSASELGLTEKSEGILELPQDAPLGQDVFKYLELDDYIFEINITPNRGDCLSILGIAREVAICNNTSLHDPSLSQSIFTPTKFENDNLVKDLNAQSISSSNKAHAQASSRHCEEFTTKQSRLPRPDDRTSNDVATQLQLERQRVSIKAPAACPNYVGRVIRSINPQAKTPLWMQERLRRCGVNPISPIVDVTNYVMLELGQPLHAFDLAKLKDGIIVRYAQDGETLNLLDGKTISLTPKVLVIADHEKPLALAGIMGGDDSKVTEKTTDVFLESAWFEPSLIAITSRGYNLLTESSQRFARGVDPDLQVKAIEYATYWLTKIVGGQAGTLIKATDVKHLPQPTKIKLRKAQIQRLLGTSYPDEKVTNCLTKLDMQVAAINEGWHVIPPTYRFDLKLEIDLIEEIARLIGYDQIPNQPMIGTLLINSQPQTKLSVHRIKTWLADRGYQEIITYSFIDPEVAKLLRLENTPLILKNPLASNLAMMRTSLWPGLLQTALYNQHRQQDRFHFFEIGINFIQQNDKLQQDLYLGGLTAGPNYPIQWNGHNSPADFFTVKGDLAALFKLAGVSNDIQFIENDHPTLHIGKSAKILLGDKLLGYAGSLHPELQHNLKLRQSIYLFELNLTQMRIADLPRYQNVSKFPTIERDLSIIVDRTLKVELILDIIKHSAGKWLKQVQLFDIYVGENIPTHKKSLTFTLLFQDQQRTLVDHEIDKIMLEIQKALQAGCEAELRS